jgi:hypothetical protein
MLKDYGTAKSEGKYRDRSVLPRAAEGLVLTLYTCVLEVVV